MENFGTGNYRVDIIGERGSHRIVDCHSYSATEVDKSIENLGLLKDMYSFNPKFFEDTCEKFFSM